MGATDMLLLMTAILILTEFHPETKRRAIPSIILPILIQIFLDET
jgi:hypothetical protein